MVLSNSLSKKVFTFAPETVTNVQTTTHIAMSANVQTTTHGAMAANGTRDVANVDAEVYSSMLVSNE